MTLPTTPVGAQLAWLLDNCESATEDDVRARFSDRFLAAVPPDRVLPVLRSLGWMRAATVDADGIAHEMRATFTAGARVVRVSASVEPEPPHRFTGLLLQPGRGLRDALDGAEPDGRAHLEIVKDRFAREIDSVPPATLALGVGTPGGREVWMFGDLCDDALFDVGSVTKTFTGVLLAHAVLRGEATLETRLSDLLPVGGVASEVTLLALATHTSGLPGLPPGFTPADEEDPYSSLTEEMLFEALRGATLESPPGERQSYSNFGFGLLARALERAAGAPYATLITERICAPHGLKQTFVDPAADQVRAPGHDDAGAPRRNWGTGAILGAGGVIAAPGDLLAYAMANARGDDDAMRMARETRFRVNDRSSSGLGWQVLDRADGTPVVWHNGGTAAATASCMFDPGKGTAVISLANRAEMDLDPPTIATLASIR